MAEEFNEEEETIINHDYKTWKKEAPFKYDLTILHSLEWPSLTFQWLPETDETDIAVNHYALIGSNSTEPEGCQLQRVRVAIPKEGKGNLKNLSLGDNFISDKSNKIVVVDQMPHLSEVNRARYCPANHGLFAASGANSDVTLLTTKETVAKLTGHSSEGYGLSWSPIKQTMLASGCTDKRICLWDVEKIKNDGGKVNPAYEMQFHAAPVEDVAWHKFHPNILGTCSDDRVLMVWDLRQRSTVKPSDMRPMFKVEAHTNEIYSLDFSPFNEFLLLSGSADESTSLWDLRNMTRSVATFNGGRNCVIKVQWSPFTSTIFASCGYGRNVDIWDISKERKEESVPLFRHGGHRSKVIDFDWNTNEKLLLASMEESNCLHVWEMARSIYYEDDDSK